MEHRSLLELQSPYNGTDIGLATFRVPENGLLHACETEGFEVQIIILNGSGIVQTFSEIYGTTETVVSRSSLLDEAPWAFSLSAETAWAVSTDVGEELEFAVITTKNEKHFAPEILSPDDIRDEERGANLAGGVMHRKVRAIFGDPAAPVVIPQSQLIVGEVVNFPGKWSSYPPHGHPHPEVYYYRFADPNGFGISVKGDNADPDAGTARVVRDGSVEQILDGVGHAQVAAPGYPMWYLWIVRHLPDNRYVGNPPFSYFDAHEWVLEDDAKIWTPKN